MNGLNIFYELLYHTACVNPISAGRILMDKPAKRWPVNWYLVTFQNDILATFCPFGITNASSCLNHI